MRIAQGINVIREWHGLGARENTAKMAVLRNTKIGVDAMKRFAVIGLGRFG